MEAPAAHAAPLLLYRVVLGVKTGISQPKSTSRQWTGAEVAAVPELIDITVAAPGVEGLEGSFISLTGHLGLRGPEVSVMAQTVELTSLFVLPRERGEEERGGEERGGERKERMAELLPSRGGGGVAEVERPLGDGGGERRGTENPSGGERSTLEEEEEEEEEEERGRLTEHGFVGLLYRHRSCNLIPCAHTCLMWKLTTYSALVRCTEMAKGSKGWKVKATRRRTA
ncbi:hypothetical protein EYF80_050573 [Liparis tanakae]|uniref:Uncharacterized protein n=1 Tax=Liparis tanakae TaxID=230148 RepID=A0A4Z2FE53_9TELE|nr:hypothetical protein EYF80_050573 [Liparis tanakae]